MLLVTVLAEMLKDYTVVLAGALEYLFSQAPFPRRIRLHILYSLPFHRSSSHPLLLPSPPLPYTPTL
ncbi:unnamed protein product [Brassica oleracea var. botrytis]|uniref:Uncharacterized protein n=4 Tax=Brassica TaxID=3705 RepID=A0A0D3CGK9_BRAOL|nr:PREDICTED: uncharacterized protein LOC106293118 [Brassica oleracea var. oleracea]XP_048615144.1 uncharacterized protein LOC111211458 [Brassica napus]KAF3584947.1 hypothetical protein F2Q69_00030168 [Brassica cretica]KAG2270725.1 hypothetical protein Bca52824_065280 [Brassica carinata]CAF1930428.1 unnamed protein product [Brassica napus]